MLIKINKMLIVNRGIIALNIIRACRMLGIISVAAYSYNDKDELFTKLADYSIKIGPGDAEKSYLNYGAIIMAAKKVGADAIYTGPGILSNDIQLANHCKNSGIKLLGQVNQIRTIKSSEKFNLNDVDALLALDVNGNVKFLGAYENSCKLSNKIKNSLTLSRNLIKKLIELATQSKLFGIISIRIHRNGLYTIFSGLTDEYRLIEEQINMDLIQIQLSILQGQMINEVLFLNGDCFHTFQCTITGDNRSFINGLYLPNGFRTRIDTNVYQGMYFDDSYDNQLVKVVTSGNNYQESLNRMRVVIDEFVILGVDNNLSLLATLLENKLLSCKRGVNE